jgi:hypothetical protein
MALQRVRLSSLVEYRVPRPPFGAWRRARPQRRLSVAGIAPSLRHFLTDLRMRPNNSKRQAADRIFDQLPDTDSAPPAQ